MPDVERRATMHGHSRTASHGMPKRNEFPNDDATIRWPLVAAAMAAIGLAALLLFGVGQLFARSDRSEDAARAELAASAEGPRVRAGAHIRPPSRRSEPRAEARHVEHPLDPALAVVAEAPDPQLERSQATTGGLDGGVGSFGVVARRGHVASVQGDSPVRPGAACDVRVLPVASGGFNCLVRVICDGALLYPNPDQTAGYVSCDVDATGPTYAADGMVSGADGDPRLTFDGAHQQVLVGDGGNESVRDYLATITLDGPRPFRRL